MSKRWVANSVALMIALLVALVTVWASQRYLKDPEELLDWVALLMSGVTTGTLAFFVTWGHFQDEPGDGEARV